MSDGFSLGLAFVNLFSLAFCVFFCFNLDYFSVMLFAFVVLDLVLSIRCQEIG